MSIRKGNTIIAGNIDAVYETDEQTITINQDEKLQVIGTINKNTLTPKYDWVGTKAEYDDLEQIHDDWLYFITDDTQETITLSNCVGQIIQAICTSSYIPNGCIPCDGTEYTADRFLDFWTNYLTSQPTKILTCTYNEYNTEITTYGQCAKFAVDTSARKFKAPTIKDGSVIQQAMSNSELGKSYNAGLPNIAASVYAGNHSLKVGFGNYQGAFYSSGNYKGASTGGDSGSTWDGELSFSARLYNTIYGNSDTVQPNAVALRYFVVVVDTYLNQSQLDWTTYTQSLNNKADKNLVNTGLITNCITEIPQDIKLELNEGILTLKAGSVVYIPNGFEEDGTTPKFERYVVPNDIVYSDGFNNNSQFLIMFSPELFTWNSNFASDISTYCYSGPTAPDSSSWPTGKDAVHWYDTSTNYFKLTVDHGSTWNISHVSLPIATIIKTAAALNTVTNINQIFNGFSYYGRTIFGLPGVKGLVPNGKNPDGTLRNIEVELDKVTLRYIASGYIGTLDMAWVVGNAFYEVVPDFWQLDNYTNYMTYQSTHSSHLVFASIDCNGELTAVNFQPKQVCALTDIYSTDPVILYKRPFGMNMNWYRLYRSGWVEQGGTLSNSDGSATLHTITLPIPMQNANYYANRSNYYTGSNHDPYADYITGIREKTATTINIWSDSTGHTTTTMWEVKGWSAYARGT